MGAGSAALNFFGVVLLAHSVYSAYEHSLLTATPTHPTSVTSGIHSLPVDITIETLIALLMLCTGVVLGAPTLRPIQWPVWASRVDQEDHLPADDRRRLVEKKMAGSEGGGVVGNPFAALEQPPGFLDIRAKRKEFADWVRHGDAGVPLSKA